MRTRQLEVVSTLFGLFGHEQFRVQDIGRRSEEDRVRIVQLVPGGPHPEHTWNNRIGGFLTSMDRGRFELDGDRTVFLEVTHHSSHNYYRFIFS